MQHNNDSYLIGFLEALFSVEKSFNKGLSIQYLELLNKVSGYNGDKDILDYIYKTYNLVLRQDNLN